MDGGQGDFGSGFGPVVGPGAVLVRFREIGGESLYRGARQGGWCVKSLLAVGPRVGISHTVQEVCPRGGEPLGVGLRIDMIFRAQVWSCVLGVWRLVARDNGVFMVKLVQIEMRRKWCVKSRPHQFGFDETRSHLVQK